MQAVFLAGLTERGPGIINLTPETILNEMEQIELALKTLPTGGKGGDFVVVSFKEKFNAVVIIIPVPAFEKSQDGRGSYAAFGFLLGNNTNSLPYQKVLEEITEVCKTNKILTVPTLKAVCPRVYQTLKEPHKLQLRISPEIEIELSFKPQQSTGETLREALKRL